MSCLANSLAGTSYSKVVTSAPNQEPPVRLRLVHGGRPSDEPWPDDDDLVRGVLAGDRLVCSALYDRLIGVVERTLYRVLGERSTDHDDLVQSAFEQIIETLQRGRYQGRCSLVGWASVIGTHLALNQIRARRRERRVIDRRLALDDAAAEHTSDADPDREADVRRQLELLRRCLADLPESRAVPVVLHDVLGHDLREVAALLSVSESAAQSRLVRGRTELKKQMQSRSSTRSTKGDPP